MGCPDSLNATGFALEELREMRTDVETAFRKHFTNRGYQQHPSSPLISEQDHSVRFIGAVTNVFKRYIENDDIPDSGYHIIQECLRTRNDVLLVSDIPLKWGSYFMMMGTVSQGNKYEKTARDVHSLFSHGLGFNSDKLVLEASRRDEDLVDVWRDLPLHDIHWDTHPPEFYSWKYGVNDLSGRGVTLSGYTQNEQPAEMGNIIVMEQPIRTVAVETGFGIEAILCRQHGLDHTLKASIIACIVSCQDDVRRKMADAISTVAVMMHNGVLPGSRDKPRLLRTYMRAISQLRQRNGTTLEEAILAMKRYEDAMSFQPHHYPYVCEYLGAFESNNLQS